MSKRKKRNKKRAVILCNVFLTIFIIALVAAIVTLGYLAVQEYQLNRTKNQTKVTNTKNETNTKEGNNQSDTSDNSTTEESKDTVTLSQTDKVDDSYFENTLFLGDSRTVALTAYGFLDEKNTFAENGISHMTFMSYSWSDSVTNMNGDIFQIVAVRKPTRIYVALGVNGIAFMDESQFLTTYDEMISKLKDSAGDAILVIESILPVNEQSGNFDQENLNNDIIDQMNEKLRGLAIKYNAKYLNVAETVKDSDGKMADEYNNGDGLHYNETGCEKIYDYICTHAAN